MMRDAILHFAEQFLFEPVIANQKRWRKFARFIVCGMGGSHLAADLLLAWRPSFKVIIHSDYGLPALAEAELKQSLIIASSYSGNTEETIDGFKLALRKKYPAAVMAVGGKLLAMAQKANVPYVQLPDTGIQPRSALGFSLKAMLKLMGEEKALREVVALARTLKPASVEVSGKKLAGKWRDHVPVIYSSPRNLAIAYNWKIKFNETGKVPAFYNIFSELNHNEMTGFDVKPSSRHLSDRFHFIFLRDPADHPRVAKRMAVLEKLYRDRGLPVTVLDLSAKNPWLKIFFSLVLADWTALYTAELYGLESEQVPMVEEFKEIINHKS